jgi:hypothetical protein
MSPTRKRSADFCATHLPVFLNEYRLLPSEAPMRRPSDSEQSEEGVHRKKFNFFRLAKNISGNAISNFFLREKIHETISKTFPLEKNFRKFPCRMSGLPYHLA